MTEELSQERIEELAQYILDQSRPRHWRLKIVLSQTVATIVGVGLGLLIADGIIHLLH